jgi:class 3 adenylate cyclase
MTSHRRPPAGSVTLLFTDIEGSTRLLERLGTRYDRVLDEHREIVRAAIAAHDGYEVRTQGDGFFIAFARAVDAVGAAVVAQRSLGRRGWPDGTAVRVRMGMHTGEPRVVVDDYVGMDVHRAARICAAAHGAQVIVSETTARIVSLEASDQVRLHDLGEHRLKDVSRPIRLHQILTAGLTQDFPPLRTVATARRQTRRRLPCRCAGAPRRRPGC